MIILRNFKSYSPTPRPAGLEFAAFTQSEDGIDWYEAQHLFSKETLKVVFDETNKQVFITNTDVSFLFPIDGASVAEIEWVKITEGESYLYDEVHNTLKVDITAKHFIERKNRLSEITEEVDRLRDEVLTDLASEEDKQRFEALIKYRKALLNTKITSTDIEWPTKPE